MVCDILHRDAQWLVKQDPVTYVVGKRQRCCEGFRGPEHSDIHCNLPYCSNNELSAFSQDAGRRYFVTEAFCYSVVARRLLAVKMQKLASNAQKLAFRRQVLA